MPAADILGRHEDGSTYNRECARCIDLSGRVRHYVCPGCEKAIPWCNGGSDNMSELCDDCWYSVIVAREHAALEASDG